MLTNRSRRNRVLTLAVLTLMVGLPELAFAQQGGLFPLAPIRRQRPPCDQEDPIYKMNRTQYYGYHPTCWRKFPEGWGCPSPEAPDQEKSFRELKKRPPAGMGEPEPGSDDAPNEGMTSPFETPSPTKPNLPPVPDESKPPFDFGKPDQGAAPGGAPGAGPANAPQSSRMRDTPKAGAPELMAPADGAETGRTTGNRTRKRTRQDLDDRPMLAMSETEAPSIDGDSAEPVDPTAVEPAEMSTLPAVEVPTASEPPTQPPAKRGMLSSLFGGNGWNWRRR